MRSEFAFLFPKPAKKARKAPAKAIRIGSRVMLTINDNEYTIAERDTRFSAAWFLVDDAGNRLPYSFGRSVIKVL